jgi:hypothetical protein
MSNKPRCTVGTDPEFFLKDKESGKLVSAIPFVKGTKDEPETLPSGGTVQQDNVALEFATPPAVDTNDFVEKIRSAFNDIMNFLPNVCELVVTPSAVFDNDQLEDERAQQFGCDRDYNAWTISENPKPSHPNKNFRSCGAHIHIGHVPGDGNEFLLNPYGKIETIRGMDTFHGLASVRLDKSVESIERRKLYGSAGCHRPTDYGVEYRVLSNFWMKSPELVMLMDNLTQDVLRVIRGEQLDSIIDSIGDREIQNIINQGNVEEAENLFNRFVHNHLSEDSRFYLDMCLEKIDNYNFVEEWKLLEVPNA